MGAETCVFVAEGETAEEVKMKMMEHAQAAHPDAVNSMSEDEMDKLMDEKMEA